VWCSDGQKYVHRSQKIILSGDRDKDVWHKIDVEGRRVSRWKKMLNMEQAGAEMFLLPSRLIEEKIL